MTPKLLGLKTYGPKYGVRSNHKIPTWPINFIFNKGGMGDFVNYAASTVWLAKNCPWVEGRLFVQSFLIPLMKDIHHEFKHWKVMPLEDAHNLMEPGTSFLGPLEMKGMSTKQFLTPMGAHPIDVASAYYVGTSPAPFDMLLPVLDYERVPIDLRRYAVIPTGFTSPNRQVTGKHINPISRYLLSKNITPVFVGKSDFTGSGSYISRFADDIDFGLGVDLRDKTSVKELAALCQHAEVTIGLDCGVLHLAALMKNSKIVFGYNVTSIEHREPRRNHGKCVNVALTRRDLECTACQSTLKVYPAHKFQDCLYGDNKCIELLFANDSERFKRAIDEVLF